MTTIGIIGGSGLYALDGLTARREINLDTPFGAPSDALVAGQIGDTDVVFLPRHGRGHRLLPSEVPYRANVFALKSLGVDSLLSVSAVGSLREEIHPGDLVLPQQYIDRTHGRPGTFFGNGVVAHVSLADPTCRHMHAAVVAAAQTSGLEVRDGGTYICIEGPAFSTRAESHLYRTWGADIIGMTSMPEVRLAREAQLHYATLALVTDYDCWNSNEAAVNVGDVVATFQRNVANVRKIISALPAAMPRKHTCACASALTGAILTEGGGHHGGGQDSTLYTLSRSAAGT